MVKATHWLIDYTPFVLVLEIISIVIFEFEFGSTTILRVTPRLSFVIKNFNYSLSTLVHSLLHGVRIFFEPKRKEAKLQAQQSYNK